MSLWQYQLVILYAVGALAFLFLGLYQSVIKKNPYGQQTFWMILYGAFVWADAVVLCAFWMLASLVILYLQDWYLFLLTQSVFWLIRSIGETLYWFLEQFTKELDPPERFWLSRYFPGNTVWFMHQLFWQCIMISTLISTIYFSNQWLK